MAVKYALPTSSRRRLTDSLTVLPRRYPLRWVSGTVIGVVFLYFAGTFVLNDSMQWDVVAFYSFNSQIMEGLANTILLGLASELGAIVLGLIVALLRLSKNPAFQVIGIWYVWFFRSVPIIVLLIFTYNISLVFPKLGIGVPFTDVFVGVSTNDVITGITAAFVGLALHEGAYMAEIIRGGIQGIDKGQVEAARTIGLSGTLTMRKVVLPQAMKLIIPPSGNIFINVLKATSLAAFVSGTDLLSSVQVIYSRNFEVIPLLVVATLWYLVIVGAATVGQKHVEKHFRQE